MSCRATSILGALSGYPCPICLVPSEMLRNLAEVSYPRRERDGALRLVAQAGQVSSKKAAKETLGKQSIRNVAVCIPNL